MLVSLYNWSGGFFELPGPIAVRGFFRMMLSGIFIVAGFGHVLHPDRVVKRLLEATNGPLTAGIVDPMLAVVATGVLLFFGGLSLFAGFRTRAAALVLAFLLVPITLSVQVGSLATLGPLFKNIGLFGALIFFIVYGSDAWSLDRRFLTKEGSEISPSNY